MKPTEIVRARKLVVGYGTSIESAVCAPVNATVNAGQALALVGPNGSGKSTLLRAFAGLLEPLSGTVEAWGEPIEERSASFRARTAVVLDEDAYLPALTVREHLLLLARGHGQAQVSTLVDQAVDSFGLRERQDAVPQALSSGQRRRMLLASAFVRPRELLLLDEPEARLDGGAREQLGERLLAERAQGVAVIFACHDAQLIEHAASGVLLIDDQQVRTVSAAEGAAAIGQL